jgi:hypothetical protein
MTYERATRRCQEETFASFADRFPCPLTIGGRAGDDHAVALAFVTQMRLTQAAP